MVLWTDVIDPATLTGYARASLADYEVRRGSLARWLPNRTVADIVARFVKGATGLIEVAEFRSYDAEIKPGQRPEGKRVTLELPALGTTLPVTEYEQLRARGGNVSDEAALLTIQRTTSQAVRAAADAMERLRGVVIDTGKATIDQDDFKSNDDFGRSNTHTTQSAAAWTGGATVDRLTHMETAADLYEDTNGEPPGCMVMSRKVLRLLSAGNQFGVNLATGGTRRGTERDVRDQVEAAGLPPIEVYNRRVKYKGTTTKVLPDDSIYFLPAPVAIDDEEGTDLGGSFWGRTLSSTEPDWEISDVDQPGIVTGVWRHEKPPMGIEVISDAIGEPVLANADLSLKLKVVF